MILQRISNWYKLEPRYKLEPQNRVVVDREYIGARFKIKDKETIIVLFIDDYIISEIKIFNLESIKDVFRSVREGNRMASQEYYDKRFKQNLDFLKLTNRKIL